MLYGKMLCNINAIGGCLRWNEGILVRSGISAFDVVEAVVEPWRCCVSMKMKMDWGKTRGYDLSTIHTAFPQHYSSPSVPLPVGSLQQTHCYELSERNA